MAVELVRVMDDLGRALDRAEARARQVTWEGDCGRWEYRDNESLVFFDRSAGEYVYEVDLDRCQHAAATLDWIAQVSKKGWATPECVGLLVAALDQRLGLQSNQCGLAMSMTMEGHYRSLKDREGE
jgi:hypothetical protein